MEPLQIFAQALGVIGFVLTFISYQSKKPRTLLLLQTVSTAIFVLHYHLIGASSGMLLNIVCIIRNIVYFNKDKKIFSYRFYPYFFASLIAVLCALSWQGAVSLLITVALFFNTVFLSFGKQNFLRATVIVTSSLILVYNVFVFSLGGILNEGVAVLSSIIGLLRYRKE